MAVEPTHLGHGIFYVSRAQLGWPARGADDLRPGGEPNHLAMSSFVEFIVHYSAAKLGAWYPRPLDNAVSAWRAIRRYHVFSRSWLDIGYNFGVAPLGPKSALILEGRGFGLEGGHTSGHNRTGHGYCFLGIDTPAVDVSPRVKDAYRYLYDFHTLGLGRAPERHYHRQFAATACPGDELAAWVAAGMPKAA